MKYTKLHFKKNQHYLISLIFQHGDSVNYLFFLKVYSNVDDYTCW